MIVGVLVWVVSCAIAILVNGRVVKVSKQSFANRVIDWEGILKAIDFLVFGRIVIHSGNIK